MDRRTAVSTTCALLAVLAIAGCGDSPGAGGVGTGSDARSNLARITTPDVSGGDAVQLAADNRSFAVIIAHKSAALNLLLVDRPFLFVVRDDATGAIVFQGRVLDPSK